MFLKDFKEKLSTQILAIKNNLLSIEDNLVGEHGEPVPESYASLQDNYDDFLGNTLNDIQFLISSANSLKEFVINPAECEEEDFEELKGISRLNYLTFSIYRYGVKIREDLLKVADKFDCLIESKCDEDRSSKSTYNNLLEDVLDIFGVILGITDCILEYVDCGSSLLDEEKDCRPVSGTYISGAYKGR